MLMVHEAHTPFTASSPGPVLRAMTPPPPPQHAVVSCPVLLVGCLRQVQTISVFVNLRVTFSFSLKGGYFYANCRWSILLTIYVKKKKKENLWLNLHLTGSFWHSVYQPASLPCWSVFIDGLLKWTRENVFLVSSFLPTAVYGFRGHVTFGHSRSRWRQGALMHKLGKWNRRGRNTNQLKD